MAQLLSIGSQGKDVKAVQDLLNYHVRRGTPLMVDGIFGPLTDARVREFQKSNSLKVDGIVGPNTRAKLLEMAQVEAALFIMPRLKLTTPSLSLRRGGTGARFGQAPRLVPPLQLNIPGFGPLSTPPGAGVSSPSLLPGPQFQLQQSSVGGLPPLQGSSFVFRFKFAVPQRNDPIDPHVQSYLNIVSLIRQTDLGPDTEDLLISFVPKPITVFTPPTPGFDWGATPLFDPFDPTGFGVKGNARFTFQVSSGQGGIPSVVVGAWGEGRAFLNFESQRGETKPRIELGGNVFFGATGVF
jgi:peptidoglycan hydrolase-like protein with peptidoglycan-binding domain